MTDRVTRIYEGALQLLMHRNGSQARVWGGVDDFGEKKSNEAELDACVAFAIALNTAVETATKEDK